MKIVNLQVKNMHLLPIREGIFKFYAFCKTESESQMLTFLGGLNAKYHGSRRGLFAILDHTSKLPEGPRLLPKEKSHALDKTNKIYQFTVGDLRLIWFYVPKPRKVIICSFASIKKGQKTPQKYIEAAKKTRNEYIKAEKENSITILKKLKKEK